MLARSVFPERRRGRWSLETLDEAGVSVCTGKALEEREGINTDFNKWWKLGTNLVGCCSKCNNALSWMWWPVFIPSTGEANTKDPVPGQNQLLVLYAECLKITDPTSVQIKE